LLFTPRDSGTASAPVSYRAYAGEAPVLSGGRRISGWAPAVVQGRSCWVADLPEVAAGQWNFTQLFVNGRRAARTRLPKTGYYRFTSVADPHAGNGWDNDGQTQAGFRPGDLQAWHNLRDVELVTLAVWVDKHLYPAAVDEATHQVTFVAKGPSLRDENGQFNRYAVNNVFEALDTPGQWYLDRPAGKLYYLPRPNEHPDTTEVIAPRLETLVRFQGSAAQHVANIRLEGLALQHAEWTYPVTNPGDGQGAYSAPGAVQLVNADQCVLCRCTVAHVGQYAVTITEHSTGNRLLACLLHDLGAGGVKIDTLSSHSEVADCHISDGGVVYHQAVGVLIADSGENVVQHNEIDHLYYTGISCGWSWGYQSTAAINNHLEYNLIHDIGRGMLSDMGGIYTLGVQPGGIIRGNVIHDVTKYGYGGCGIYLDEGSSDMLVENNLTYRTDSPGFNMHYGRDDLVRNNIFAYAKETNIGFGLPEAHRSFVFAHNIVLWDAQPALFDGTTNNLAKPHRTFSDNVYWDTASTGVNFGGLSFADWRKLGNDAGSQLVDPQFINAFAGDFRLRATSPALALGFTPFDTSSAGPRALAAQRLDTWPAPPVLNGPVISSLLEVLPGGFTREQATGKVRLKVKNYGLTPATGAFTLVAQPAGAARIDGESDVSCTLQPGEEVHRDFTVELLGGADAVAIETLPYGDAVIPTCCYIAVPAVKGK
jgi:hypothetical protein